MAEAKNREHLDVADRKRRALSGASAEDLRNALRRSREYDLSLCTPEEVEAELKTRKDSKDA